MSIGPKIYKYLALFSLVLCVVLPVRVLFSSAADYARNFENYKAAFNNATLLWFLTAPVWMIPELFHRDSDH